MQAVRRLVGHALFTKAAAHKLVTCWQDAKCRALGPRHQVTVASLSGCKM